MYYIHNIIFAYRKVASKGLSQLVAHQNTFRMFIKGKFDAHVCTVTFEQKFPK